MMHRELGIGSSPRSRHRVPVGLIVGSAVVAALLAGPDGNLWFTEIATPQRVVRITPAGAVNEFTSGIAPSGELSGITAGPDGNLWFTDEAGQVGRMTTAGTGNEFAADDGPNGITAGPDGNLWFTEEGSPGRIARINTGASPTRTVMATGGTGGFSLDSAPDGI